MLALLLAAVLPLSPTAGPVSDMHPMHTAVVEIGYDPASSSATIRIRVFADDLGAALADQGVAAGADSAMSRYVRGTFALANRAGRPLVLHWEGAERAGDVVLLQVRASVPQGLAHARVLSALLSERFEDQVNIVRASYAGRTTTLLFTRGDPARTLP